MSCAVCCEQDRYTKVKANLHIFSQQETPPSGSICLGSAGVLLPLATGGSNTYTLRVKHVAWGNRASALLVRLVGTIDFPQT